MALGPGCLEFIAVLLIVDGSAHDFLFFLAVARNCRFYPVDGVLSALEARDVLYGGFGVVGVGLVVAAQSCELLVYE